MIRFVGYNRKVQTTDCTTIGSYTRILIPVVYEHEVVADVDETSVEFFTDILKDSPVFTLLQEGERVDYECTIEQLKNDIAKIKDERDKYRIALQDIRDITCDTIGTPIDSIPDYGW